MEVALLFELKGEKFKIYEVNDLLHTRIFGRHQQVGVVLDEL